MTPDRLRHIESVFQVAVELDPGEREAFLRESCHQDDELRTQVASLLDAHDRSGSFIETPAAVAPLHAQPLPRKVGPYTIDDRLGTGGMSEVFLATDRMGRKVAFKVLGGIRVSDPQYVSRFRQEAAAVLALNHPNIVTAYDMGEFEGLYYIASELVEGQTLRQRMGQGEIPLREILDIMVQVTTGIAAAHARGIVHRDIKPENVMIRHDGFVKVLDFGIAKLTGDFYRPGAATELRQDALQTREGSVIGTVAYMSPEQVRGSDLDGRADVWSIGVMLYEMITGERPFDADNSADVAARILEREPLPLSRYLRDPPSHVSGILDRALAKAPEARYVTSAELLQDLKSCREEIDFSARLERLHHRGNIGLPAGWRRAGVVAVAVASVLCAVIAWYALRPPQAAPVQSVAVLPFVNATGDREAEYLSSGMTESLINHLAQLPGLSVKARSSVLRYQGREHEPREVAGELQVEALVNGRLQRQGDRLILDLAVVDGSTGDQLWGTRYERPMAELPILQGVVGREVALHLRQSIAAADVSRFSRPVTASSEAYQLYLKGRYHVLKFTLPEIQAGIALFEQAIAVDPSFALAYVGLADAYRTALAGDMPPPDVLLKARQAVNKAIELDESLADAHAELGFIVFWHDWDRDAAERQFQRALELEPNNADAHLFYAHLLSNLRRHGEALAHARRARELDPLNPRTSALEGQFLIHAGRVDEALARLQKTLDMAPNHFMAHFFLSSAYIEKGRYDLAIAEARLASEVSGPSNSHPKSFLIYALAKSGDTAGAHAVLDELLDSARARYVSAYNIALAYNGLGDAESALRWLERGLVERDQKMVFLHVEPKWANLRADPRYQDLVRRIGY